jgi:hypothetical protein
MFVAWTVWCMELTGSWRLLYFFWRCVQGLLYLTGEFPMTEMASSTTMMANQGYWYW